MRPSDKILRILIGGAFLAVFIGVYRLSGNTYFRAYSWIRQEQEIREDVGEILSITPIKEKSCYCAFTDGCSCAIFLEIKGSHGSGRLEMNGIFVETLFRDLYFSVAIWNWQDETIKINDCGWEKSSVRNVVFGEHSGCFVHTWILFPKRSNTPLNKIK